MRKRIRRLRSNPIKKVFSGMIPVLDIFRSGFFELLHDKFFHRHYSNRQCQEDNHPKRHQNDTQWDGLQTQDPHYCMRLIKME